MTTTERAGQVTRETLANPPQKPVETVILCECGHDRESHVIPLNPRERARISPCAACQCSVWRPKLPQFVAVNRSVMRGQEHIATAVSRTMAMRIARALNTYKPNSRGF